MLIGEAEILGQVKDAYIQAQKARSLGKTLHALFREALNAGKESRANTGIGSDSISVATAAIDLAKQRLGTLDGQNGARGRGGQDGRDRGEATAPRRLLRAPGRQSLAGEGARNRRGTRRGHRRRTSRDSSKRSNATDIVVTSTGASHFVLTPGNVAEAMLARPDRQLFIIDIAVPRDADPDVARVPNVHVADIDQAQGHDRRTTLEKRRESIPLVEEIIAEHADRFARWYQSRVAIPVVSSLVQKAESIREGEIERLFARCAELTERERMLITGASLTIISKLLA